MHKGVVGEPALRRLLGRCGNRRDDNIKMDLKEVDCKGVNRVYVV